MKKCLFVFTVCLLLAVTTTIITQASLGESEKKLSYTRYFFSYQGFFVFIHQEAKPENTEQADEFNETANQRYQMLTGALRRNGFVPFVNSNLDPDKTIVTIDITGYDRSSEKEVVYALSKNYPGPKCKTENCANFISIIWKFDENSFERLVVQVKSYLEKQLSINK